MTHKADVYFPLQFHNMYKKLTYLYKVILMLLNDLLKIFELQQWE